MGFSLSDTVVAEGTEMRLEYKHHLEGNFCIAGEGEVSVGNAGWLVGDGRQAGSVALG